MKKILIYFTTLDSNTASNGRSYWLSDHVISRHCQTCPLWKQWNWFSYLLIIYFDIYLFTLHLLLSKIPKTRCIQWILFQNHLIVVQHVDHFEQVMAPSFHLSCSTLCLKVKRKVQKRTDKHMLSNLKFPQKCRNLNEFKGHQNVDMKKGQKCYTYLMLYLYIFNLNCYLTSCVFKSYC